LSGSTDRTLRRWSLPRETGVNAVAVTSDGTQRFQAGPGSSPGTPGWIEKWDSTTNKLIREGQLDEGPIGSIAVSSLLPLIVVEQMGSVTVCDSDSLEVIQKLKGPFGPFESVGIGGKPAIVVTSDPNAENSTIRIWDITRSPRLGTIAVTPDGRSVAGASDSRLVSLWDPFTGRLQAEYSFDDGFRSD
jgi:WD40 repeat protein